MYKEHNIIRVDNGHIDFHTNKREQKYASGMCCIKTGIQKKKYISYSITFKYSTYLWISVPNYFIISHMNLL